MSKKEKKREIKPVSFNMLDPEEKELYEYATRANPLTGKPQNFSKYVKRLIDNDIRGVSNYTAPSIVEGNTTVNEEVKNAMTSFL